MVYSSGLIRDNSLTGYIEHELDLGSPVDCPIARLITARPSELAVHVAIGGNLHHASDVNIRASGIRIFVASFTDVIDSCVIDSGSRVAVRTANSGGVEIGEIRSGGRRLF